MTWVPPNTTQQFLQRANIICPSSPNDSWVSLNELSKAELCRRVNVTLEAASSLKSKRVIGSYVDKQQLVTSHFCLPKSWNRLQATTTTTTASTTMLTTTTTSTLFWPVTHRVMKMFGMNSTFKRSRFSGRKKQNFYDDRPFSAVKSVSQHHLIPQASKDTSPFKY